MVIQHLGSAYQAMKSGLVVKPEGVSQDVRSFFSLPIPKAIRERMKLLQNDDFVEFVERCRSGTETLY
jgi:bifunctional DNA-binding transcriptional regulator/antitoxin component of YhaV-PrlF toxin-antitoxin module